MPPTLKIQGEQKHVLDKSHLLKIPIIIVFFISDAWGYHNNKIDI